MEESFELMMELYSDHSMDIGSVLHRTNLKESSLEI